MKTFILLLGLLLTTQLAFAGKKGRDIERLMTGRCDTIQDRDLRYYCQGNCMFINDRDLRQLCREDKEMDYHENDYSGSEMGEGEESR